MSSLNWTAADAARLDAIRDDLAQVSTATAFHLLQHAGLAQYLHEGPAARCRNSASANGSSGGRAPASTCCGAAPERLPTTAEEIAAASARRLASPEIVLIESLEPGDIFCVDALGVPHLPGSSATS